MVGPAAYNPPGRILIIRPSALGDVCRTVPVLASLRHAFPDSRIDWVVQDTFIDAVAAHPALNEVIPFPRGRFARWWRHPGTMREMIGWFSRLRGRRYDLVLDCQGLGRSGLITRITGAGRRVGHRGAREFAWLGYNARHATAADAHTVDRMLALVGGEGVDIRHDMRLYVADADATWWRDERRRVGLSDGGRYAVLAPTSRWPSKRWPAERFARLLDPLSRRGLQTVVVGAPGEADQVGRITSGAAIDLVGRLTIGRLMAVIADGELVIGNDSAPLHMAVGLDVPCLALFGPTDPDRVGPYGRRESVIRAESASNGGRVNFKDTRLGDSLMRLIDVDEVERRIDDLLAASTGGVRSPRPAATAREHE